MRVTANHLVILQAASMSDSDQTSAPAKLIALALSKDGCSEQRCMVDDNIQQDADWDGQHADSCPGHRWDRSFRVSPVPGQP